MTELPDVNEMYPQKEPDLFGLCINCNNEIFKKEECVGHAGYVYCSGDCLIETMFKEGNAERLVAGE